MSAPAIAQTVAQFREAFDAAFAWPKAQTEPELHHLLAVQTAGSALALKVVEIAGIMRCPPLLALPSENPWLCGLSSVRSALTAVYELTGLLGEGQPPAAGGWVVLCAAERSVALRFDHLLGYERIPAQALFRGGADVQGRHGDEIVQMRGARCSVVRIPELLDRLRRSAPSEPHKE